MKILSLIAFLSFFSAQADIILYKNNLTVTRTGAGQVAKMKITGWTLIDGETGELVFVIADVANKSFTVEYPMNYALSSLNGGNGKNYSVIAVHDGLASGAVIKGLDKSTNPYSSPSSAIVGGSDLFTFAEGGPEYLDEYKGSIVFDKANTLVAKNNLFDIDGCLNVIRAYLGGKGYSEE